MPDSPNNPPIEPIEYIELRQVETNNLKSIDANFPIGKISVVTGVSGSGKSSLVFDTLYGEAYRRYVESLSSFARQYLKALPKPKVNKVRNLPPAVAVKQARSGASNRSTVGTMTEMNDILRILFSHLAEIFCRRCGAKVEKDTPESITQAAFQYSGQKIMLAAPLATWGKLKARDLKGQLEAQGFTRLLVGSEVVRLTDTKAADLKQAAVVVDRIQVKEENRRRLIDSAQLALKVGRGQVWVKPERGGLGVFSNQLECLTCGLEYFEPTTALLSFNHPLGACQSCQGFGYVSAIDYEKVIPDQNSSLSGKGVAPWNFGKHIAYYKWAITSAKKRKLSSKKIFSDYTEDDWQWLKKGIGKEFDGIEGYFAFLDRKKYKPHYRIHAARFRKYVLCPDCKGDRLNEKALACQIQTRNLAELSRQSIDEVSVWLMQLVESVRDVKASLKKDCSPPTQTSMMMGLGEAIDEAKARFNYLKKIGVGYLTLDRSSRTLSGGELQRIHMARCLGSALTETLFCLDEPTSGLHSRDSGHLLEIIRELRDQGNTVVLVEHEQALIKGADHLIEIGPKAGHEGGRLVYAGLPSASVLVKAKPTLAPSGKSRSENSYRFIELLGAETNNLKGVDIKIPVGAVTAVCGVSGSGKTSLIQHTLYPLLAKTLGHSVDQQLGASLKSKGLKPLGLIKSHAEVMLVSQAALGRSSRSNIATYLGIMDDIRKVLAAQPMAKKLGLSASAFSFNVDSRRGGGRCDTCKGLGTIVEDLSFLGEMEVICPACQGRRFREDVLKVEIRGHNLIDILNLTISEVREFFYDRASVVRICEVILTMGMGYLTLGQHTSSFSGGEAQRLKLVSLMKSVNVAKPSLLIFDEPTTGLSDYDVAHLIKQLQTLAEKGHTIIVVEHHLDVLRAADWLIEVGPEAAHKGGEIVYQGPSTGISEAKQSVTAPYMLSS